MRRSIARAWRTPAALAAGTALGLGLSLLATGGWRWLGCALVAAPAVLAVQRARRRG